MKTTFLFFLLSVFLSSKAQQLNTIYPPAPRSDIKDTLWGDVVADRYRKLEIDNAERDEWIEKQEAVTQKYFKGKNIKYFGFHPIDGYRSIPIRSGPYYITQSGSNLFYRDYLRDKSRLVYSTSMIGGSASKFTKSGISDDGKYCALMYSTEASDWQDIRVYNFNTSLLTKDHIRNVKHSDINWWQNGFYYSRYDSIVESKKNIQAEKYQRIYYHTMGTDSRLDSLIFDDPANPDNTFWVSMTMDKRFVIITEDFPDENRRITFFKDTHKGGPFKTLLSERGSQTSVIGASNDTLIALTTNGGATNGKIVEIDTKNPLNWLLILDNQKSYRIKDAYYIRDTIIVIFQQSFSEYIAAISRQGNILCIKPLPAGSSSSILCFSPDQNSIILRGSYDVCPDIGELFSLTDYSIKPVYQISLGYNPNNYKYYQTNYISTDSTIVPIYILSMKDNLKKGPQPTLLVVDGTFGYTPERSFNAAILTFLDNGCLYAVADIRGGSKAEKSWLELGTGFNKQNAIDDIYHAAKFLTDSGFATKGKLAIAAGEYAAVSVAAVINQHPETFRVALFNNGLFYLIRYERFTSGKRAIKEFGSVSDDSQFQNILSFDPIYNIKPDTIYPSVFLVGSKLYNRVPPLHSYKYAASLQSLVKNKNQVLLYMINGDGYTGYDTDKRNERLYGYYYRFLFDELGLDIKFSNNMNNHY